MQATVAVRNHPTHPATTAEPSLPVSADLHLSIGHEESISTRLERIVITPRAVLDLYNERIEHFYITFNTLRATMADLHNDISHARDHLLFFCSRTKRRLHRILNQRISSHLHALLSLTLHITNVGLELHEENDMGPAIKAGVEWDLKALGVQVRKAYQKVEWAGYEVDKVLEIWDGAWRGYLARETGEIHVREWREGEFMVERR
ncbi:hypothetical protein L211DRAFT_853595 [Terfezia boudieri ATCC MYA-4762]|uniref:Uncharacterized protein n=1 Tax=Terfezia boudieri ATCC MYA-4762 TaxID=1051890 RepID=A0A3N4L7Q9_9PEZI|nr:hypothetical protein L211DRAFT_853595 [Terfezia boudieri ATCC MYA-4762]